VSEPAERVELTELDVIARYSLAVRSATADRDELIQTLQADLDWLQGGRRTASGKPAATRKPRATTAKTGNSRTTVTRSGTQGARPGQPSGRAGRPTGR